MLAQGYVLQFCCLYFLFHISYSLLFFVLSLMVQTKPEVWLFVSDGNGFFLCFTLGLALWVGNRALALHSALTLSNWLGRCTSRPDSVDGMYVYADMYGVYAGLECLDVLVGLHARGRKCRHCTPPQHTTRSTTALTSLPYVVCRMVFIPTFHLVRDAPGARHVVIMCPGSMMSWFVFVFPKKGWGPQARLVRV